MTSRMTAAAGLAAAAVLLGACAREASPTWTLVVDEPPQRADGVRYASDRFAFRLDGRTPVVVTVFLDDVPIARGPGAPAGTVYVVEGFPAPDGDHVVAVGVTGPATWKSDPVAIRLDRLSPTLVAWAPAPDTWEAVLPDTPRLEARFSEPLAPERVRADAVRATDRNGAAIGVAPSLSEDGGTLRLDFPRSLALYETVTVALDGLEDLAGNPVRAPQQTWRQPRMWVELGLVPGPWPRRGDVRFAFTLHGGVSAERVELLRGDQVVASSEAPPFPLSWSSTGEPDGVFEFSARALRDGTWSESSTVTVRTDNTPPTLVSAGPAWNDGATAWVRDRLIIRLSEEIAPESVAGCAPLTLLDGTPVATSVRPWVDSVEVTRADFSGAPRDERFTPCPGLTDVAGNPLGAVAPVPLHLPEWWERPWDPREVPGTTLHRPAVFRGSGDNLLLAWEERTADGETAAWYRLGYEWAAFSLESDPLANASQPAVARDSRAEVLAWVESVPGEPTRVFLKDVTADFRWRVRGPLNVDPLRPASDPAVQVDALDRPVVAWSEATSDGGAAIRVARWDGTALTRLGGELRLSAGGVATRPSLALPPGGAPVLAWEELGLDGRRRVALARFEGAAWSEPLAVTVAAGADATDPSLAVAPTGDVLLATVESAGAASSVRVARDAGTALVPVGAALEPTGASGRLPFLRCDAVDCFVAFVATADGLDRVRLARRAGDGWAFEPGVARESPAGAVEAVTLALGGWVPMVVVAEGGELRVIYPNR